MNVIVKNNDGMERHFEDVRFEVGIMGDNSSAIILKDPSISYCIKSYSKQSGVQITLDYDYSTFKSSIPNYGYKGLVIDIKNKRVTMSNQIVLLTNKEFAILSMLYLHADKKLSLEEIINEVWHKQVNYATVNTLRSNIKSLRHKLGPHKNCVQGVYGYGYKFQSKN